MKSHEVLRAAADVIGVKALANQLKLSPALVYKWCQESQHEDPDSSGTRNPLDRMAEIVRVTGHTAVINWVCHEVGGFFVRNPLPIRKDTEAELLRTTQVLIQEFGDLLSTVSRSIEDDGRIASNEADRIRDKWELLKYHAESFVVACESGCYQDK